MQETIIILVVVLCTDDASNINGGEGVLKRDQICHMGRFLMNLYACIQCNYNHSI